MGIRSDLQTELRSLLASDIIKGKVSVQRAYADWRRYPQYVVPLAESSIDMIMATAYGSAKKNATDIRLAIDAIELVFVRPEIGTFILLSGDSDFSSLVIKLKEYGKYVIGVGIRESSSDLLVMNCDEYYSYNALAGLVKSGEEELVKHDPWELVSEAIQRMKRNGDVMRADRLKQVMQQIDSSFDEKDVGKAKFSVFVSEAAKRGLLSINKLENGQLEVDLPRASSENGVSAPADAAAAQPATGRAAPAAPAPESDDAERSRRGGRRGRGRGREERVPKAASAAAGTEPAQEASATRSAPQKADAPKAPAKSSTEIGATGLRLTRDEAFDLVCRAVASVATGGLAAPSSNVRAAARSLLGRDSESLSERNFMRILHDAHDADVVDLRKRGSDYEVAPAVAAAPVDRQLADAATANAPVVPPPAPVQRGMGSRGTGRGALGAKGAPPANLLSVGVVGPRPSAPVSSPASAAPTNTAKPAGDIDTVVAVEESATEKPARGRKRVAAKKPARKEARPKAGAASAEKASAPAAKKRATRKKTARPGSPDSAA